MMRSGGNNPTEGENTPRTHMKVIYTDKAKKAAEFDLLQRATADLEEIAGPSGAEVTATWDRSDNGRLYVLRLSDWSGEVSRQFYVSELWSAKQSRWPLLRIWGDLLELRSHKLMDKLLGTGDSTET
jgi:hypothetical protein